MKVNGYSQYFLSNYTPMTVGSRIKEKRKSLGMRQTELARQVHLDQSTLSDLERGHSNSSAHLASIAKALSVDSYWLETGKGNPETLENIILSQDEIELIQQYRRADDLSKRFILASIAGVVGANTPIRKQA